MESLSSFGKATEAHLSRRRLPFRDLGAQGWQNLGLAAIAIYYGLYVTVALVSRGVFFRIGGDYLAFWSAGVAANEYGYGRVYDLAILKSIQEKAAPQVADPSLVFVTIPVPFLSVFILPFQLLALLEARVGFVIWTLVNALVLAGYLTFFMRSMSPESQRSRTVWMVMLAFPVFANFVEGQINVFLTICIGEFLRAVARQRSARAGLWLAGLLAKPQFLILILPALFLQRSWKILAGFTAGAMTLLLLSFGMAGLEGLGRMVALWVGYTGGIASNSPQNMMNWRMVITRLSALATPWLGWSVGITGMVLTLFMAIRLWRIPTPPASPRYPLTLLGTLAATGALTWHAHVHMLMLLIPPLLMLRGHPRWPAQAWYLWLFLLPLASFLGLIFGLLIKDGILPPVAQVEDFLPGLFALGLNLYFLLLSRRAQARSVLGDEAISRRINLA